MQFSFNQQTEIRDNSGEVVITVMTVTKIFTFLKCEKIS